MTTNANAEPASATGLTGAYLEAQNPATQQRVTMAVVRYSQIVQDEKEDVENHDARIQLASQVARQPTQWTMPFTLAVCAQGVNSQSDDGAIMDWLGVVWNTLAGVPITMPRAAAR